MLTERIEKALNHQIGVEEHSSRIYLAMASWCEVNGFPGAAAFLYRQSDEERMHMLKIVHYVNDRGGHALLDKLENPVATYASLPEVFHHVFEHERYVSSEINKLYGLTLEEKDYTTGQFMQWYIEEQIEEESTVKGILDKMQLAGQTGGGMYHIDKELGGMAAAPIEPAD
ncbi:MAG TPA: ferritin [Bacteroidales bacterium]|nr:ferritin [Lentimicrobiaceae bacterium]HOH99340.1 ferritin [Bacteroidales bacterium]